MTVARVCVDIPTRALSEPFDYEVPDALAASAVPGAPVYVPFGSGHALGYVVGLADTTEMAELKPIESVLGEALFREWAYPLAAWIAREYAAPLADSLHLFLPPGGAGSVETVFRVAGPRPDGGVKAAVFDAIVDKGQLTGPAVARIAPSARTAATALVKAGALSRELRLKGPRTAAVDDRWAEVVEGSEFVPRAGAVMHRAVLDALSEGPVRVSELAAQLGSVDSALRRLADARAVEITKRRRMRTPSMPARPAPRPARLSDGQQRALETIADATPGSTVLLDGVTGSGKTEVYLQAIERVLAAERRAIVLVPEISLTPQTVGRFRSRFGEAVAVLHSRLSAGERYDQWDLARRGDARVVIGPRSALFAPVPNLGLVVIDEEHEPSYKQGSAPRYHARRVAQRLCSATGAVLVLGSATPSMETMEACRQGRCSQVVMPERVGGGMLPRVDVVDMASEFAEGHRSLFSRPLLSRLEQVAERGEKAVLFLNRRGFASFVLCRECGFVPGCPSCSVSLTYHESTQRLVCHHCGHRQAVPARCPRCDSPYMRQFGAGTQRVESELAGVIPDLPIVRMDADTTSGKGGHERQLAAFEELESGVLVGTQMIAKGLDYPEVTLVGVLNADTSLHMPDFRASERTYQLLAQVSGRAGRGERPGTVVLQTYWPDHPAIAAAAAHDPGPFYAGERKARRELGYPPFGRLANVTLSGRARPDVIAAANVLAEALAAQAAPGWSVLGPSPSLLERVKGVWRWHVLVKTPAGAEIGTVLSRVLTGSSLPDGVSCAPDVDALDLF